MADLLYILTIFLIKTFIVLIAIVAIVVALTIGIPYAIFWPIRAGMSWGQAVRLRMRRLTAFVWRRVEFAFHAIDTPA